MDSSFNLLASLEFLLRCYSCLIKEIYGQDSMIIRTRDK